MKFEVPNRIPAIKAGLPITFVLETYGHELSESGGKFTTLCMFHDDTNPSFDVFGEAYDRWGCFSCGVQGDVFDLIQRFDGCTVSEAIDKAQELLDSEELSQWSGPRKAEIKPFDRDVALATVTRNIGKSEGVHTFLDAKIDSGSVGLSDIDAETLTDRFRLGSNKEYVIIPYYDSAGEFVTYKYRTPTTKSFATSGSSFNDVLYGLWLDDGIKPVILCEGETDVWAADHAMSETHVALGIPTGVRSAPKQAELLTGRTVLIAFDGDAAGRAGTKTWEKALKDAGAKVSFAILPDGQDLATCNDIVGLLSNPVKPVPPPEGIAVQGGVYVNNRGPLCGWSIRPTKELIGEGGYSFVGELLPSGEDVTISASNLSSGSTLNSWALAHGHTWRGTDNEARLLHDLLHSQSVFLPKGKRAHKVGVFGANFVWPGGTVGPEPWTYAPPIADTQLSSAIRINPGPWNISLITALRNLNTREITDPILAWLAAAPLRSKFTAFPILAVTGSSGTGKTTLVHSMLSRMLGCDIAYNLVGTTPFAMTAIVGASNGFPVWFDEYRPQAGRKILDPFNQILRDAYTCQGSVKGGMRGNWAELEVIRPEAPIIVSGEDAFSETSHTERMVQVLVKSTGKSSEALVALESVPYKGFAHAYLSWLVSKGVPESIHPQPGSYDPLIPERTRQNLGVLYWGWDRLTEFCRQFGLNLGEPEFGGVYRAGIENSLGSPIKDALLDCMEDTLQDAVQADGPYLHVAPGAFVAWASKRGVPLPGGRLAIIRYLLDNCQGEQIQSRKFGAKQVRAISIPKELLLPDEPGRFEL